MQIVFDVRAESLDYGCAFQERAVPEIRVENGTGGF